MRDLIKTFFGKQTILSSFHLVITLLFVFAHHFFEIDLCILIMFSISKGEKEKAELQECDKEKQQKLQVSIYLLDGLKEMVIVVPRLGNLLVDNLHNLLCPLHLKI